MAAMVDVDDKLSVCKYIEANKETIITSLSNMATTCERMRQHMSKNPDDKEMLRMAVYEITKMIPTLTMIFVPYILSGVSKDISHVQASLAGDINVSTDQRGH